MSDMIEDWGDFAVDAKDFDIPSATQLFSLPTQSLFCDRRESSNETSEQRFGDPISDDKLKEKHRESIPKKTRENTKWALSVWNDWISYREQKVETLIELYTLPKDLSVVPYHELDFLLSKFVVECRRKDGKPYPPTSLTQIMAGIQRHMRDELGRNDVNFFSKTDPTFANFRKSLDAQMKELASEGIGIHIKKKDPVLPEDEKSFWENGVFSMDTAQGLSNAVFFYNCKAFGFRGLDEHVSLEAEQFSIQTDPESKSRFILFEGRVMNNVQGGLNHRKVSPKTVKHFENPENDRCLVKLYSLYLSFIPQKGGFYRRPLPCAANDKFKYPRFSASVISQRDLSGMMKTFYKEAGINISDRNISNHSGRVTCCTTLYNNGFDDKAVSSRSWHRSSAVNTYKRELTPMLRDISNTLAPPPSKREFQSATNNSKTLKAPQDFRESVVPQHDESDLCKENLDSDDTCVIQLPSCVKKIIIVKGDKKIKLEI